MDCWISYWALGETQDLTSNRTAATSHKKTANASFLLIAYMHVLGRDFLGQVIKLMQSLNNESNPKQTQTRFWRSKHAFFYQTVLRNTGHVVVICWNG